MAETAHIDGSGALRSRIVQVRRLIRFGLASAAAGKLLALLFCIAVGSFVLDRALRLSQAQRAVLAGVYATVFAWWFARELIVPLARKLPETQITLEVEKRSHVPRDLLTSALQFAVERRSNEYSPELRDAVVARGEAASRAIVPLKLINWATVRRSLLTAVVCLLVGATVGVAWPQEALLWARRNLLLSSAQWPRRTRLQLIGFAGDERVVPKDENVEIAVRAHGALPRTARLLQEFPGEEASRVIIMKRIGRDVFRTVLPGLRRSCTFTVEAGDGLLLPHKLRVVKRPRIARADMLLHPPAYLEEPPRHLAWNTPALPIPDGSRVDFKLTATKRLQSGTVTLNGEKTVRLDQASPHAAALSLMVTRDVRCAFMLRDTEGIGMAEPLEVTLRVVEDTAPQVALTADRVGERVTPTARIPLRIKATDDHAVHELWLTARYEDDEGSRRLHTAELPSSPKPIPTVTLETALDLMQEDVAAGGRLACTAGARDMCDLPAPNTGKSSPLVFRVVTAQDLLAALLVGQQDVRQDLEQQIDLQKEVLRRLNGPTPEDRTAEGLAVLAARERSAADVLESCAQGYRRILEEMLSNRVATETAFEQHVAGIVEPLRQAAPGGAMLRAAGLLENGTNPSAVQEARIAARDALSTMQMVRSRMLLLETYAEVAVAVEEITQLQRKVLEATRDRYRRLLEGILGGGD